MAVKFKSEKDKENLRETLSLTKANNEYRKQRGEPMTPNIIAQNKKDTAKANEELARRRESRRQADQWQSMYEAARSEYKKKNTRNRVNANYKTGLMKD